MSRSITFAYPGDLSLKTGGYGYDRRIIEGLRAAGWRVDLLPLGPGFPDPDTLTREAAETALSALDDGTLVMIDGLAFGVLDQWAYREKTRLRIVALTHHPLALETGLPEDRRADLQISETNALSAARAIVVTSTATARTLSSDYGVPETAITVVLPGTDRAARSTGSGGVPHILSIGTLIRRKGHDILIEALARLADRAWTCTIIGSRDLDPETAADLARRIAAHGLEERIRLAGECDDTRSQLGQADIFALASRYEGYGMVFAEALVQGVPIVACATGAVPEVVPADAGLLVAPDDSAAFAQALDMLLADPARRRTMSDAAAKAGARLPGWDDAARHIAACLERVS